MLNLAIVAKCIKMWEEKEIKEGRSGQTMERLASQVKEEAEVYDAEALINDTLDGGTEYRAVRGITINQSLLYCFWTTYLFTYVFFFFV